MDSIKKFVYAIIFMIGLAALVQSGSFQTFILGFASAISQMNSVFYGLDPVVSVVMSGVAVLLGAMVYSVFRE